MHDPGSMIQDPGSRIQDPRSRIQDSGSRIQEPGSRIQDPGLKHRSLLTIAYWLLLAPIPHIPSSEAHKLLLALLKEEHRHRRWTAMALHSTAASWSMYGPGSWEKTICQRVWDAPKTLPDHLGWILGQIWESTQSQILALNVHVCMGQLTHILIRSYTNE